MRDLDIGLYLRLREDLDLATIPSAGQMHCNSSLARMLCVLLELSKEEESMTTNADPSPVKRKLPIRNRRLEDFMVPILLLKD